MRPIRLIQIALVVIAVGVIAAVALQIRGSQGRQDVGGVAAGQVPPTPLVSDEPPPGATVVSGEVLDGPNRRWAYQFDQATESEKGVVAEGVRIDAVAANGGTYRLQAEHAEISADRQFVRAERNVRIDGDDLALRADWAEHYAREGAEVLGGHVVGKVGERLLVSDRLEYASRTEAYRLDGDISLLDGTTKPPILLHGQELQYRRAGGTAMLKNSVFAVRGRISIIDAHQVDLHFVDGLPIRVVFQGKPFSGFGIEAWNPNGCDDEASLYHAWTPGFWVDASRGATPLGDGSMMVRPYPDGGQLVLEGQRPPQQLWSLATINWTITIDAKGRARTINAGETSWRTAPFDGLSEEQSWHAMEVRSQLSESGALESAEFPGGVEATRGPVRLSGTHAVYRDGVLIVDRAPRLTTETTTLEAQTIAITAASGEIRAAGDVRSRSRAGRDQACSLLTLEPGQIVQARAREMSTERAGGWIVYRGEAQLWQGPDLLSADEIRADTSFAVLAAKGAVSLRLQGRDGRVIQAFADQLDYDGESVALRGSVRLLGTDLRLEGEAAELWLEDDGRGLRRLVASGNPVVGERAPYRSFSRRLEHDTASSRTTLLGSEGELARVVDREGNETLGDRMTLWLEQRRVRVGSEGDGFAVSRVGSTSGANRE